MTVRNFVMESKYVEKFCLNISKRSTKYWKPEANGDMVDEVDDVVVPAWTVEFNWK